MHVVEVESDCEVEELRSPNEFDDEVEESKEMASDHSDIEVESEIDVDEVENDDEIENDVEAENDYETEKAENDDTCNSTAATTGTSSEMITTCTESDNSTWSGFKIVGDNLDHTVRPRHMSLDRQTRSLNYFNSYAVRDRINLSSFSSFKPVIDTDVNFDDILPSPMVHSNLMKNMATLVSRILVDNLEVFKFYFEDAVERHILHTYSKDMEKKSEVVSYSLSMPLNNLLKVSLGIYLHSEQKYDEMLCILDKLYKYVPKKSFSEDVIVEDKKYSVVTEIAHQILVGGDQMTAARCRGCQGIRINSDNDSAKLCGFHPVAKDWHTKVVLLKVTISHLITCKYIQFL